MLQDVSGPEFEKSLDLLRGTELNDFRSFILECQDRLRQPMRVAVIGEISSSKSTLVNAMLGEQEVVRTGPMEETYNVSWLTSGDPDADITVQFKDPPGHKEIVHRRGWAHWANRMGQSAMQNNVSYIEVAHDSPALKTFSLIDTPGLNSYHGIDSQNTIEFLQKVRPDAVVLLFAKSISQRLVDVVKSFQGPLLSQMSPVNAIGVLAKIDTYWPGDPDPVAAGSRVAKRLFTEEASVENTLYQLQPVCAGLALGARTLSEEDMACFRTLAKVDVRTFQRSLSTAQRFVQEDSPLPLLAAERAALAEKFTRYGIFCAVEYLRTNGDASRDELSSELLHKSGFDVFFDLVTRHFGRRSELIKLAGVLSDIRNRVSVELKDVGGKERTVVQEIGSLFANLSLRQHELQELGLLADIYAGKIVLDGLQKDELLRVAGENGASCVEKLGLPCDVTIEQMQTTAWAKSSEWHEVFVSASGDPCLKRVARVMEKSYRAIGRDVENAATRLAETNRFLWGEEHSK